MRVFVAIEISKTQILENIKKFQENVKIDAKPTRTDQIHFTLQFLGEIDEILCEKIKSVFPDFSVKEITKDEIPNYWSYSVKQSGNLFSVLSNWSGIKILTSRKGKLFNPERDMDTLKKSDGSVLVVFGSTDRGIHDILGNKINNLQNSKTINFFPNQGTQTVRIEEAVLGCLSVMNTFDSSNK